MIDKKKLIEELLDFVADSTDNETKITTLTMVGILMNEVLDEALRQPFNYCNGKLYFENGAD